jgi:hypothetical protein
MAGDWLKIESDTPDKPEVLAVAAKLGTTQDAAFGMCFRVWRWFDRNTQNGNAIGVTYSLLNAHIGVANACEALESVGWMTTISVENGQAICLPNFSRHNGKTAKARALTSKRVSRSREKEKVKRKCNAASVTSSSLLFSYILEHQPEWIPNCIRCRCFSEAWDAWVAHRNEIRKPLKPTQVKAQLEQFGKWGSDRSVAAIKYTIQKGWQGIREPEVDGNGKHQRDLLPGDSPTVPDVSRFTEEHPYRG